MVYDTRAQQARCASLGFWPGPIDGIMGNLTRVAVTAATEAQRARGLPLVHPSGLTRVHWHWTAGTHRANSTDRAAYHTLIEGDGTILHVAEPTASRSHTRNANSGAIGISLCAMSGAVERPFSVGKYPVTMAQVAALVRETARICLAYDIPVSRWSTLSHAEIQPSLGIAQKQKWDICWLPDMAAPGDPIFIGDRIRNMVRAEIISTKGA